MSLKKDDVEKIALLARLKLNDSEVPELTQQISSILDLVDQMNSVDTSQIKPMAHPMDAHARLRLDVVSEIDQRQTFQAIAPAVEDGLYLVPKVIE